MRLVGRYISGDLVKVDNFTRDWAEITIYEDTFWNDESFDEYARVLKSTVGHYTDLDDRQRTCVRFELEEDAVLFKMAYSRCI